MTTSFITTLIMLIVSIKSQRITALRTRLRFGFVRQIKTAGRKLITTIKHLALPPAPRHQMPFFTRRAGEFRFTLGRVLAFVMGNIVAIGKMATADKHAVMPLFQHQRIAAFGTGLRQHFQHLAFAVLQRLEVITVRICATAQKQPFFPLPQLQRRTALRTKFGMAWGFKKRSFMHRVAVDK